MFGSFGGRQAVVEREAQPAARWRRGRGLHDHEVRGRGKTLLVPVGRDPDADGVRAAGGAASRRDLRVKALETGRVARREPGALLVAEYGRIEFVRLVAYGEMRQHV